MVALLIPPVGILIDLLKLEPIYVKLLLKPTNISYDVLVLLLRQLGDLHARHGQDATLRADEAEDVAHLGLYRNRSGSLRLLNSGIPLSGIPIPSKPVTGPGIARNRPNGTNP